MNDQHKLVQTTVDAANYPNNFKKYCFINIYCCGIIFKLNQKERKININTSLIFLKISGKIRSDKRNKIKSQIDVHKCF